ncbi:MAG: tRNA (guanosine(46)-N7)-methyltransferase TrmB [Lachnospiraceae bacterium]
MRLRKVKGAEEAVAACPCLVADPKDHRGHFAEVFGQEAAGHPLHLEIGMGKGRFITEMACRHPEINFVGMERFASVLVRAVEKQDELQLPNVRFLFKDAEQLNAYFGENEIDRIYLNFSDPWPKDRHAKRRLSSPVYLARYCHVLRPGGVVEQKTDNAALFEYSLESFRENGWTITSLTYDLHHSEFAEDNVMTEYEQRFSQLGNKIMRLTAVRPDSVPPVPPDRTPEEYEL